ncbi:hypothetical protein M422DRAFT_66940 [Sphaerobolus stellatus SS14]|uniref:Uncharacterized protein n=1 Tax=Sphaerobolus stellatus (strain SS14) TaxID=990650 RepID=A0A0C9W3Y6_SPHS4|nr:hypothetical protein M422DRAFT_66940 [Sphaerobolus stellatus SS14]
MEQEIIWDFSVHVRIICYYSVLQVEPYGNRGRIIGVWTTVDTVLRRVIDLPNPQRSTPKPRISDIDGFLEDSISTILVCRFMLQIRKAVEIPRDVKSNQDELSTFHAVVHRFDETIAGNFGADLAENQQGRRRPGISGIGDESEDGDGTEYGFGEEHEEFNI